LSIGHVAIPYRSKLEASLAAAKEPADLNMLARSTNGEDLLLYYWAMAMDTADSEDPEVVTMAANANVRAQQSGYQPPPKEAVEFTIFPSGISSGTGAASPFSSPGMAVGRALVSSDGRFRATMQHDGNFVVYDGTHPIWATQTDGKKRAPYRLAIQPDGNVVVYGSSDKDVTVSGFGVCRAASPCIAMWATGPRGGKSSGTGPYTLTMQDDGNLVLYDSTGLPLWASGTQR
jgi:hypothetical protein